MKEKKTTCFILVLLVLTSCDPIRTLAVYNATNKEKHLEVVGILRDSVPIQQIGVDGKLGQAKLVSIQSKSERGYSFTFTLPPQQYANLEAGFGTKPVTNRIIIDATDTVIIKESAGRVKKKPFYAVGGNYILKLKE